MFLTRFSPAGSVRSGSRVSKRGRLVGIPADLHWHTCIHSFIPRPGLLRAHRPTRGAVPPRGRSQLTLTPKPNNGYNPRPCRLGCGATCLPGIRSKGRLRWQASAVCAFRTDGLVPLVGARARRPSGTGHRGIGPPGDGASRLLLPLRPRGPRGRPLRTCGVSRPLDRESPDLFHFPSPVPSSDPPAKPSAGAERSTRVTIHG